MVDRNIFDPPADMPKYPRWSGSPRTWLKSVAVVLAAVLVPTVLLWLAMINGKVWPFDDNYYDPFVEIPKSYHRHPDAFQDAAYKMLSASRKHPDALHGSMATGGGNPVWLLNRVDPKTGEQAEVRDLPEPIAILPDVPKVPGGRTVHAYWQHTDPDCVFFFYQSEHREDREKIDALKETGRFVPASSVVLAYHPAHKPPRRFIDEDPLGESKQTAFREERQKDPLFMGYRRDWKSKNINAHWTVFYW